MATADTSLNEIDAAYRRRVLAFRATGHHLDSRLPKGELVAAIAKIGIRDVRTSGLASLHARVQDVAAGDVSEQLGSGAVLEVISARGTDTLVPAADVAVFTLGTVPSDEESLRARFKPWLGVMDRAGLTATEAVEVTKVAAREALADGPLDTGALSSTLTATLPELSAMCHGRCGAVHIVQGLFDLAGESGLWHQQHLDDKRIHIAMEEPTDMESARRELVRRYLGCYGPSTPAEFAEWCGISRADAARSLHDADTVQISPRRYILGADLDRFESQPAVRGVRILPPRDPYLLDRDRTTLIPDRDVQREIWRATPVDGLVLIDGTPAATWRPKKTGQHFALQVRAFGRLSKDAVVSLRSEAAAIATHRGCSTSDVVIT